MKRYFAIMGLTVFLGTAAAASSWQNKLQELKEVAMQITHLKLQLQSAHKKKSSTQEQLKHTEAAIAGLSSHLEQVNNDLAQQQQNLKRLEKQLADKQDSLQQEQQQLKQALQAIYIFHNTNHLKLLLNQQNPYEFSQSMAYYRYLIRSQMAVITQVKQSIAQIQQQQQQIQNQMLSLKKLQTQQQQKQQRLLAERHSREQLLADIAKQIKTKAEQLNELSENQRALENLVNQLKASELSSKRTSYQGLKGKHPWPLQGPILIQFGSAVENSQLTWKGIVIGAKDGTNVQAVAPGKVIFANWLKGFGFLIIIEHGQGYMSLYGRNQSLYKKVGDYVQSGELIARAGRSGGFSNSGLYFEIRHQGKPVNPLSWLS